MQKSALDILLDDILGIMPDNEDEERLKFEALYDYSFERPTYLESLLAGDFGVGGAFKDVQKVTKVSTLAKLFRTGDLSSEEYTSDSS